MTHEPADTSDESSVRVELLGYGDDGPPEIMTTGAGRAPSRLPAAAMVLLLLGLVGGLWWLSDSAGERDAVEDIPEVQEQAAGLDQPREEVIDRPGVTPLTSLDAFPTYVVEDSQGLLAGGAWVLDSADGSPRTLALSRTQDGSVWTFGTLSVQTIPFDARIVGMYDDGADIVIFIAAPAGPDGATEEILVHRSDGGTDDVWRQSARFGIDGHVRSVSARGNQWVAIVDPRAQSTSSSLPMQTQIITGFVDGRKETTLTEVAPDEFVSSYAATDDGFYAIVVRLELNNRTEAGNTTQLRRWTVGGGWEILDNELSGSPAGSYARVIDGGVRGVFVSFGTELFLASDGVPAQRWPRVAQGVAVTGALADTYFPEATPARVGNGFFIVDTIVGDVGIVWVSINGLLWQRFEISIPIQDASLLRITKEGEALIAGVVDGSPSLIRVPLTRPNVDAGSSLASIAANTPAFQPEVLERTIVDGEWSTPVFSAASNDGDGFVGLSNVNGQISLIESDDGFEVTKSTVTNFPFGYFTNDLQTTNVGFHAIGQLGLFEDAVFTSVDGVVWDRFAIDRPGTATALQIDNFHRSETTAVMSGSLGWADNLARTELVSMWWNPEGEVHLLGRPCADLVIACSITSLVAVNDGALAIHQAGGKTLISKWTERFAWDSVLTLDAISREPDVSDAYLQSVAPDEVAVLGLSFITRSSDAGDNWDFGIDGPPGVDGQFVGLSASGETALLQTSSDAWLLADGVWTRFTLEFIELGPVLAITDRAVLTSGRFPSRSVVIRFAVPGGN